VASLKGHFALLRFHLTAGGQEYIIAAEKDQYREFRVSHQLDLQRKAWIRTRILPGIKKKS
jgi:hypothetical protein